MEEQKNLNSIDQPMEDALRLLEQSGEETADDVKRMLGDDACVDACKDLWLLKNTIERQHVAVPDVEAEWGTFMQGKRASHKRPFVWGMLSGVAASFLVFLSVIAWQRFLGSKDIVAYQASTRPAVVTLQANDDGSIVVGNDSTQLTSLSGHISQTDSSITYNNSKVEEPIQQHVLTTSHGKIFKVTLADGTAVWLNANSSLSYPSRFEGGKRHVRLSGEAYFQVARNEKMPFVVETNSVVTKVLGTEFNVKAYAHHASHVTLVKGSVDVASRQGRTSLRLHPGEDATIAPNGTLTSRMVDTDVYAYWKEGYFYFDNTKIVDVMRSLGEWYNMDVVFKNSHAMHPRIHFFCEQERGIAAAVDLFNMLGKAKARVEGNTLYIE